MGLLQLLLLLTSSRAARPVDSAEGVGVTTYDAHWHTSKLTDSLAAVVDDFLPAPLLARMTEEALLFNQAMVSESVRSGRHGFWLDFDGSTGRKVGGARLAIEHAIERMLQLDFPDAEERRVIGGAEWWFQLRTASEGTDGAVGFHYDKDEGLAGQGRLHCPHESTITYLTSGAAPTFIVNRTTPDGNACDPLRPLNAALAYPRAGRHVLFRGNLAHGVLSELSAGRTDAATAAGGPERLTLLANWWPKKPRSPNCQLLSDERVNSVLASGGLRRYDTSMGVATAGTERPLKPVAFKVGAPIQQFEARLRFLDHMDFELPADFDRLALEAWDVQWAPEQVQAQFGMMDFDDNMAMDYIFKSDEPKVLVFSPWNAEEGAALKRVKRTVLPAVRALTSVGKVIFADTEAHADALSQFGSVPEEQLRALGLHGTPVLVYHDAIHNRHAAMVEPFSGASVARFVERIVAGEAETVADGADEDDGHSEL